MRHYLVNDENESLRTLPSEITLKDFTETVKLQGDNFKPNFEYYLNFFEILGLSKKFLDIVDIDTLTDIISDFQKDFKSDSELIKQIEISGVIYKSYEEEFKIKAKDFGAIEKYMSEGHEWMVYAMMTIFKEDGINFENIQMKKYFDDRKEIFLSLTMDICLPYIVMLSSKYLDNIQKLVDNGTS